MYSNGGAVTCGRLRRKVVRWFKIEIRHRKKGSKDTRKFPPRPRLSTNKKRRRGGNGGKVVDPGFENPEEGSHSSSNQRNFMGPQPSRKKQAPKGKNTKKNISS